MARTRYRIVDGQYPYFVTCTIVGWLPIFTRPEAVKIVLDSWKYLDDNDRLTIHGFVILENHLHLIAQSSLDLAEQLGDFRSFTARGIIDLLEERKAKTLLDLLKHLKARHKTDRTYQVWQEGMQPKQIENAEIMRQKLDYMHYNPVERGYVDEPVHWRYSSARNYAGLPGLFPVETNW